MGRRMRRRRRRRRGHLASIRQVVNRRIRRPLRMMFTVLFMMLVMLTMSVMFRDEPVILVLVSRSLRCLRLQVTERRLVLVFRRSVNPLRHLDTRR